VKKRSVNLSIILGWIFSLVLLVSLILKEHIPVSLRSEHLYIETALSLLLIFVIGLRVHIRALKEIGKKRMGAAPLISVSSIAAAASGILTVLDIIPVSYAPAAAVALVIFLSGEYIGSGLSRNSSEGIQRMKQYLPEQVRRIRSDGKKEEIKPEALSWNDVILVKPGERVGADGSILEGATHTEEYIFTGHKIPIDRNPGDPVYAGTLNAGESIRVEVHNFDSDTILSRIIRKAERAYAKKKDRDRFREPAAVLFLFILAVCAALVFLGWRFFPRIASYTVVHCAALSGWTELASSPFSQALMTALGVLSAGCAAAFGLSGPSFSAVCIGKAAGKKIFFTSHYGLEYSQFIETMIFDRWGTLTKGNIEVSEMVSIWDEEEFYSVLLAMESKLDHPLSEELCAVLRGKGIKPADIGNFSVLPGKGIQADYKGTEIFIGSAEYIQSLSYRLEGFEEHISRLTAEGRMIYLVAADNDVIGIFSFEDSLRPQVPGLVSDLSADGIDTVLLTGQWKSGAAANALESGIDRVMSDILPEDKYGIIDRFSRQGRGAAFAGDGLNDAAALYYADIGVTLSGGDDAALKSADVILDDNKLEAAADLKKISRCCSRRSRTCSVIVAAFALPSLAAAALGFCNPLFPLITLALSSFLTVLWSLLLRLPERT
jgi:heavy metal translocating P-type ATPase